MNRSTGRWCQILASIMALVVVPVALADDVVDKEGQYQLEGSWWRVHIDGGGGAYMATISRYGAQAYGVEFQGFPVVPGLTEMPFPTTQVTSSPGVIQRVGVNEYEFTWVLWYGDQFANAPHRGTVYAVVCFGPLIQDSPDHLFFDNTCFVSINPCYVAPTSDRCQDLGDDLWDPFTDPARLCPPLPPSRIAYQRIPLVRECP